MRTLDVDYVLVILEGLLAILVMISTSFWMVRIAEGNIPKTFGKVTILPTGRIPCRQSRIPTLLNCLMYKMSYYRFGEMQLDFVHPRF